MTESTALPKPLWEAKALLGEGPIWDGRAGILYWVDIKGRHLHQYRPSDGDRQSRPLAVEVGAVAPRARGGLIGATRDGFAEIDPDTGAITILADPESGLPDNRFNDGKCDPVGRFIAGSMDDQETSPSGSVYRLDADHRVTRLFGGYMVCNGPAFSPDGRILYFSNSAEREILAFPYDPAAGEAGPPRVFARIPDALGYPDGLNVDADGGLWCAHWDGWRLTRFRPDGTVDRTIEFPVPRVTSSTFGGPGLDRLYVTTARIGLDDVALARAPLSGALFEVETEFTGLPQARFAG